ncbi:MAG TPA: HNH endonuclease [Candidatus Entotheonella sp.]|jgi:hypothetical protein
MSDIPEATQRRVRERAGNRCEYCLSHQDYVMGRLQIDHIQPVAKGGSDDDDNLCLACELCNQHKWTKTHGVDSDTGQEVALFHPRQQRWSDHFAWRAEGAELSGLTACGRATISALSLNNPLAVIVRRNWIKAGWHPP